MEDQGLFLADGLEDPPAHLLLLGEGQLLLPVVEPVPLGAGGGMGEDGLVVPEDFFVVQIEVVVPDHPVSPQGVVKGGVQVIILPADPHNVPGVAVADALVRVVLRDDHDAPQPQGVAQGLHRLGDALAHAHPLAQRAQDLVGVGLFQLVVPHVLADEVVDVPLLFNLALVHGGAGQLGDPGGHGPLVLPDLPFVKEVLGQKLHRGGGGVDPAGEAGDIEDLRVVQAELEQDLPQLLHLQPGDGEGGAQLLQAGEDGVVGDLPGLSHAAVIVELHAGSSF